MRKDPVTWVETYIDVIACRCKQRPPSDAPVIAALKRTAEERARQRALSIRKPIRGAQMGLDLK